MHTASRNGTLSVAVVCGVLVCLLLPSVCRSAPLTNGLYAAFDTSMGSFTARLDYAEAPLTVANFIGLAEGSRAWYEEGVGIPRHDPFYDGTLVNRIAVLDGAGTRIVQTGSRNGTNSGGGPGYTFRDEFSPRLRHDRPGIMSMANSGKNSNGSQYFFALGALPHLDDVHSVFGEVIYGLDVLTNISLVPLEGGRPVSNVVFEKISILRVGQEASGFAVTGLGLPVVTSLPLRITMTDEQAFARLDYPARTNGQYVFCTSATVRDLAIEQSAWSTDIPVSSSRYCSATSSAAFYAVTRVDYADPLYVPANAHGYRITDTGNEFDLYLDSVANTGMAYFASGSITGHIQYWSWTPDAYRSRLWLVHGNLTLPFSDFTLCFTQAVVNSYDWTLRTAGGDIVNQFSGTFTCASNTVPSYGNASIKTGQ
jgi:cyclophilin family peptidyl-prolyl cis-trans isomerase